MKLNRHDFDRLPFVYPGPAIFQGDLDLTSTIFTGAQKFDRKKKGKKENKKKFRGQSLRVNGEFQSVG